MGLYLPLLLSAASHLRLTADMGTTKGLRRGTRYMFARDFRKHGPLALTKYLTVYKRGDIVDIKGNGAIQKGMPHKSYHGKTGRIYNVSKRAVGIIVNKRINVRIEHLQHSKCRLDFHKRVEENNKLKKIAKETGVRQVLKRLPAQPREAESVNHSRNKPVVIHPLPFEFTA